MGIYEDIENLGGRCKVGGKCRVIIWMLRWLMIQKVKSEVAQSCRTLCNPMDFACQGPSVHGIIQARILEQVAVSFFMGSSRPRNWTWVSCTADRLYHLSHSGKPSKSESGNYRRRNQAEISASTWGFEEAPWNENFANFPSYWLGLWGWQGMMHH